MSPPIIALHDVCKSYPSGDGQLTVLDHLTIDVAEGEFLAVVGPSGNGKTTLLNLIAGIDRPNHGDILVAGKSLNRISEAGLSVWRAQNVGIVFQFFQLLPGLSLLHNVMLPMDFACVVPRQQRRERAMMLLEQVGMSQQARRLPFHVSGGQQQRVAIARALANNPAIIVADEPTGNLDSRLADEVFSLFAGLADQGKTLIMVTHNEHLAHAASRCIEINCGKISSDVSRGGKSKITR